MEPKVTLIDWYHHPIKTMHAMAQNMRGNMIHDLSSVTLEEAIETVKEFDPGVTRLSGVLEFCKFVFQVDNVPRAFTHQHVRHRTCSFSQESLRFTVKAGGDFKYDTGPTIERNPILMVSYEEAMDLIRQAYSKLITGGADTQDARGVLPINTMTKIGYQVDLRQLITMAEVRDCYQSQPHWKSFIRQTKQEIKDKVEGGEYLASLLIPACERSGRCEFKSTWDRKCPKEDVLRDKLCNGCRHHGPALNDCGGWRNDEMCRAMERFMK